MLQPTQRHAMRLPAHQRRLRSRALGKSEPQWRGTRSRRLVIKLLTVLGAVALLMLLVARSSETRRSYAATDPPHFVIPSPGYVGWRYLEPEDGSRVHNGVDIWSGDFRSNTNPSPCGAEVRAAYKGTLQAIYRSSTHDGANWVPVHKDSPKSERDDAGIVVIRHDNLPGAPKPTVYSLYLHMAKDGGNGIGIGTCISDSLWDKFEKPDKSVSTGEVLGRQGDLKLGGDRITHLHFAMSTLIGGGDIDPSKFLCINFNFTKATNTVCGESRALLQKGDAITYSGQTLAGTIDQGVDPAGVDRIYFAADQGSLATIRMARRGSSLNSVVSLDAPSGSNLANASDGDGSGATINQVKLPQTGLYMIRAGSASSSSKGDYSLTVTVGGGTISVLPGESSSIVNTVITPKVPVKPDVILLADTTGSMGGAIASVRAKATDVINQVKAVQPNARFGAAQYKDFNCDFNPYRLDQALTDNTATVQNAINSSWFAFGGCDWPEAQINALYQLATNITATGWRSDGSRIIAWFGDAPGHNPSNGHSLDQAIAVLKAQGIRVIAVNVSDLDGCSFDFIGVPPFFQNTCNEATKITTATGGRLLSLTGTRAASVLRPAAAGVSAVRSAASNPIVNGGETANDVPSVTIPVPSAGPRISAAAVGPRVAAAAATTNDVADAILAGLTSLPVTVTPQVSGCGPLVTVTFDAPSKTVTSGESVSFTATITVAATVPPGTLISCRIDFLLDGRVITDPAIVTPITIMVDTTPPTTSVGLAPLPNANHWNNSDVTVTLAATDNSGGSGVKEITYSAAGAQPIASTTVPSTTASFVITTAGQTNITFAAKDNAGNVETAQIVSVLIDKTAPTVTYTGNPGTYTVDQPVAITCAAADALSGVASTTCKNISGPASTFKLGANAFAATATDKAGNTGKGETSFTVKVTYTSLCRLTNQFIAVAALRVADADCAQLDALAVTTLTTPEAKAAALASYTDDVTKLVGAGALTPAQATILLKLAQALAAG